MFRKSRAVIESASLTAGTRTALSTTVKVPAGVSRIIGIAAFSEGGGVLELQASSLGESVYIGLDTNDLTFIPANIPIQALDEITLYRTAQTATSSKYEVVVIYFA